MSSKSARVAKAARHEFHQRLIESRTLSPAYLRARPVLGRHFPTVHTDIVIEGFPRSANTYAVAAFQHANPDAQIASHLHSARAVLAGVRQELPVLVLIRDPVEAAASLMVFWPGVRPRQALRHYCAFYESLGDVRQAVTVATFPDVVDNYATVLRRVNARFRTSFALYDKSDESEEAVRRSIELMEGVRSGGEVREERVARPSAARAGLARIARARVVAEAEWVDRARVLYARWANDE